MNLDALNSITSKITEGINSGTRLNALADPVADTMIKGVGSITDNIETMGGTFLYIITQTLLWCAFTCTPYLLTKNRTHVLIRGEIMEQFVHQLFDILAISQPDQLNITAISALAKISVKYWDFSSEAVSYKGKRMIFINEALSVQKKWQEFAHELYHLLGHVGNQNKYMHRLFMTHQEKQAEYFSYHFCVPTFMLQQLKGVDVYVIMRLFNVEFDFAMRRLEMYQNKILSSSIMC